MYFNLMVMYSHRFVGYLCMGTTLAPALATIYVSDLEEAFIGERRKKPDLWVRYIDDVFYDLVAYPKGTRRIPPRTQYETRKD